MSASMPGRAPRRLLVATALVTALTLTGCGSAESAPEPVPSAASAHTIRIGTGVTVETRHAAYVYAAALSTAGYSSEVVETGVSREDLFEAMGIDTASIATADPTATEPAEGYVHMVPDLSGDLLLYLTDNGEVSPTSLEEERATARAQVSASASATAATPSPAPTPSPTDAALNVRGLSSGDIVSYVDRSLPDTVTLLDPSKATNRYGYAVTAATAQKYGIGTMEDLSEHCGELTFTVQPGFETNPAGAPALDQHYGCAPSQTLRTEDRSERTWQLMTARADIAYLYSTSTDIARNNFTLLDDPQGTQLAQNIVPLTRAGEVPAEAQNIINGISAQLDTPALMRLEALTGGENPISETAAANFWLETVKG